MKALQQTHCYAAHLIRNEISKLKVCFKNSRLNAPDARPATLFEAAGELVAYRIPGNEVYVSIPSLKKAKEQGLDGHAVLPIHEALHTFIPAPEEDWSTRNLPESVRAQLYATKDEARMSKLYTFADAIVRNARTPYSPKDFAQVIQDNSVQIPATMGELDAVASDVLIV